MAKLVNIVAAVNVYDHALLFICWQLSQPHQSSSLNQVDHIVDVELAHNVAAVPFNCPNVTANQTGYFLVAFTIHLFCQALCPKAGLRD